MRRSQIRFTFVCLIFLGFLLAPCPGVSGPPPKSATKSADSKKKTPDPHQSLNNKDLDYVSKVAANNAMRTVLRKQLIRDACSVAKETSDPEAEEHCEFLSANLFTFVNIGRKLWPLDDVSSKYPLGLFVFVGNEDEVTPELEVRIPDSGNMGYAGRYDSIPTLVIRNNPFSKLTNGLVMLREGNYVRRTCYRPRGAPAPTDLEIQLDRVRANEFQFRLINKIGGAEYAALLREEVERYIGSDQPLTAKQQAKLETKHFQAIAAIFKADNAIEVHFLLTQFRKESRFLIIDRFMPNKEVADEIKAEMYW